MKTATKEKGIRLGFRLWGVVFDAMWRSVLVIFHLVLPILDALFGVLYRFGLNV